MTKEEVKVMFEKFRIDKGMYWLYSKEDIEQWVERYISKHHNNPDATVRVNQTTHK